MASYFDRYEKFRYEGKILPIPYIRIPVEATDKNIIYKLSRTRLDKVSQTYYNNPYHGFLIMLANPLSGSVEFEIPDNFFIRIPFPLITSLQDYKNGVELYSLYYGEN